LCALTMIALFSICFFYMPQHGLIGQYYDNSEWKGDPVFSTVEKDITLNAFEHAMQFDNFPRNNMSIAWNGWLRIHQQGEYQFFTTSDDGSSVIIDNVLVVNNGGYHELQKATGKVKLSEGLHRININYFNGAGTYGFTVWWEDLKRAQVPIPPESLFPVHCSRFEDFLLRHAKLFRVVYFLSWLFLCAELLGLRLQPGWVKTFQRALMMGLIEGGLCLWILLCVYIWWVLNGNPGLQEMREFFVDIAALNSKMHEVIWPFVYKKYIWAQ